MNTPILAVDIGKKKTGLALSESGMLARPLSVIRHEPKPRVIAEDILNEIKNHDIQTIVFGMPFNVEKTQNSQMCFVISVINSLKETLEANKINIAIFEQDEFATTKDAGILYPEIEDDAGAAAIILQDFLDEHKDS